ncbi:hypothetical protein PUN28_008189 [Cardiocondyla obscurior]|uniref:Uncharacterized protein n=1 Tax=Cardiocondyla obscurior TaxID=286306 RepID=A0AAW2G2K0_9HYME
MNVIIYFLTLQILSFPYTSHCYCNSRTSKFMSKNIALQNCNITTTLTSLQRCNKIAETLKCPPSERLQADISTFLQSYCNVAETLRNVVAILQFCNLSCTDLSSYICFIRYTFSLLNCSSSERSKAIGSVIIKIRKYTDFSVRRLA